MRLVMTNKLENSTPKKGGHGGARKGSGRKPFEFTEDERKQVEALSGYGLPHDHIAVLIGDGIDVDTLRKHFPMELARGKAKANGKIGQTLFQKAMGGDTTAMIWWSKTQMKWSEVQKHELTGKNGDPIKVEAESEAERLFSELLKNIELRNIESGRS
jgi:hypothetical protein